MFSSVGSPPAVTRALKFLHWLTVFLQFASFYIVASAAAWFDKRKTGIVSPYSHSILQDTACVVISAIIPPWFFLVRTRSSVLFTFVSSPLSPTCRDCARTERLVLGLFILSVVLLVFSALSFTSALFRDEIRAWSFLGFLSIIADLLLVVSCILALVCRVRFGIGLEQFPVCKPICGSRGSLKTD
ncbi:hypothetical protein BKA83DRAFT_1587204 [Pisolithus microcarpus]|nr:hypothetical protein BKA83DRAFT_1587204 [Pisolithus microcarpus]